MQIIFHRQGPSKTMKKTIRRELNEIAKKASVKQSKKQRLKSRYIHVGFLSLFLPCFKDNKFHQIYEKVICSITYLSLYTLCMYNLSGSIRLFVNKIPKDNIRHLILFV